MTHFGQLIALVCLASIPIVIGWTFIPVSDNNMIDAAHSVVVGVVDEEIESGSLGISGIYRHYKVNVIDRLKDDKRRAFQEETITVNVIGGFDQLTNRTLHIPGAPHFAAGQTVLLFLQEHQENFAQLTHFALGAFYRTVVTNAAGEQVAVAVRMHEAERAARSEVRVDTSARHFDRFADYIRGSEGKRSEAESAGEGEEVEDMQFLVQGGEGDESLEIDSFGYMEDNLDSREILQELENSFGEELGEKRYNTFTSNNRVVRWKAFDTGLSVVWKTATAGNPGLSSGGDPEAVDCMNAWNSQPNTPISYVLNGKTDAITGLQTSDLNSIIYEDPANIIDGSFSCSTGGTLAVGGWYSSGSHSFRGETWTTIVEGDIVVQDGISCWFQRTSDPVASYENMLSHEMGHTLGMAHSCTPGVDCVAGSAANDALMRATAHANGGPALQIDDSNGIDFLYSTCYPNCAAGSSATPTTARAASVTTRAVTTKTLTTQKLTTQRVTTRRRRRSREEWENNEESAGTGGFYEN